MQKHPSMFLRLMRLILGRGKNRDDEARTTEETLERAAGQPKSEPKPKRKASKSTSKGKNKRTEKAAP